MLLMSFPFLLINMHSGCGKEFWMRNAAEEMRKIGLISRSNVPSRYHDRLDLEVPKGGGRTNPWTYTVTDEPFIFDPSVKSPEFYDLRELPHIGD